MKTCLIVDDSQIVRKVARHSLNALGFHIIEAQDGQQALLRCTQKLPAVVLLDWYMPVMNGLEFLRALRALPGGHDPVVIFCTTQNDPQCIAQAMAAGADEYIMKPFDDEILKSKLMHTGVI